jgi:hypothetical protein
MAERQFTPLLRGGRNQRKESGRGDEGVAREGELLGAAEEIEEEDQADACGEINPPEEQVAAFADGQEDQEQDEQAKCSPDVSGGREIDQEGGGEIQKGGEDAEDMAGGGVVEKFGGALGGGEAVQVGQKLRAPEDEEENGGGEEGGEGFVEGGAAEAEDGVGEEARSARWRNSG